MPWLRLSLLFGLFTAGPLFGAPAVDLPPPAAVAQCLMGLANLRADQIGLLRDQTAELFKDFIDGKKKLINSPLDLFGGPIAKRLFADFDAALPKGLELGVGDMIEIQLRGNKKGVDAQVNIPPKLKGKLTEDDARAAAAPSLELLKVMMGAAKSRWPDLEDKHFTLVVQFQRQASPKDGQFHDHAEKRAVANVQLHPTGGGTMFKDNAGSPVRSQPGILNIFSGDAQHARPGAPPDGGRLLLVLFIEEPSPGRR